MGGNGQAILKAVFDPFESAAAFVAEQYGAEVRDLDTIAAADDIDAVIICTPTDLHAQQIERFARAGKAIFCEKPIDLTQCGSAVWTWLMRLEPLLWSGLTGGSIRTSWL